MKIPNKKVPLRFTQDTYDVSKLSLSLSMISALMFNKVYHKNLQYFSNI